MSSHPLHGTKPLAASLTVEARFEGISELYLWKLQRVREYYPIKTASGLLVGTRLEIMTGERFVGTETKARQWGEQFPGWEVVHA
jgi:hypothetical protein